MTRAKLFVDLGHSDKWPGADGVRSEVAWNRAIYPHFMHEIDESYWEVILVPDTYTADLSANMNLMRRINWINARATEKDFLISIHGNAASRPEVRGVTTCYVGGSDFARLEAIKLSQAYSETTEVPVWLTGEFADTRSRYGRLGMVRDTKPFALLIEAGFVTSPEDMKVNPLAAGRGIANYFNSYNPNHKQAMPTAPASDESTDALNALKDLKIMNDISNPDRPVTRRELALIQFRTIAHVHELITTALNN